VGVKDVCKHVGEIDPWLRWFGFMIETIFDTAPAASKNFCLLQKCSKLKKDPIMIISLYMFKSAPHSVKIS